MKPFGRVLLFTAIAACGVDQDELGETRDPLYGIGTAAPRWGTTNGAAIPTCWVDPSEAPWLQAQVKTFLRESWSSYAKIDFVGWNACSQMTGRKVSVAFSYEPDYRGNTSPPTSDGSVTVTLIAGGALTENAARFRYQVIHEFGHALGFAHEMQRPDNWSGTTAFQCGVAPSHPDYGNYAQVTGGIYLTPTYDPSSIMNYCNPVGYLQDLSVGDVRGVRVAYGRRDIKGGLFRIDSANQLHWYRHDGRTNGSFTWAASSGNVVGNNWVFKQLFSAAGSDGILYTVDASNRLQWWRHDGRVDGGFRWSPGSGNVVGTGWNLTQLFGAGDGAIYGISPAGELKWYRHDGRDDGSFRWAPQSGNVVGVGWNGFKHVFSGGDGVIYTVSPTGELKWYRHDGRANGSFVWAPGSGNIVGTGWGNFKRLFSGGDGVIYAIDSSDRLLWYRHDGRTNGSFVWAPGSGNVVGTGWTSTHLVGDD